jgi:hypothetical protein
VRARTKPHVNGVLAGQSRCHELSSGRLAVAGGFLRNLAAPISLPLPLAVSTTLAAGDDRTGAPPGDLKPEPADYEGDRLAALAVRRAQTASLPARNAQNAPTDY